jgi:polyisoprenoid-binding protein YceI
MDTVNALSFLLIGFAAITVVFRNQSRLNGIITFLLVLGTTLLVVKHVSPIEQSGKITWIIMAYVALNFALSRIESLKIKKWSFLIPISSAFALVIIGKSTVTYSEYDFSFGQLPIILLTVFGSIIMPLVQAKSALVKKVFALSDTTGIEKALIILFIGVGAFIGMFFASGFGLLLITIGFSAQSFFQKNTNQPALISLLSLTLIYYFIQYIPTEIVDLSLGKTLEGLFIGAFSVYFVNEVFKTTKIGLTLVSILLSTGLIAGILWLATQKADFGGMDAFIGVLVGSALIRMALNEFALSSALFALTVAIGLIVGPSTINKEEQAATSIEVNTGKTSSIEEEKDVSPFEMKGMDLSLIKGNYRLDEKSVKLNFQLGPKGGVTKGTFKSFTGKVNIAPNLENSIVEVYLPVNQLSTFNSMRDESLMAKEYFDLEKFPTMTYESKKLVVNGDVYELNGKFTMLGMTNEIKVKLKYVGNNETSGQPILVGKSFLDRTQFGMKPDSKEGNIVDFEFKIELIKI